MDDGVMAWDDGMADGDKDRMYCHHWEKYSYYRTMIECHKRMHGHCTVMLDYHYKMCMHYRHGHPKPPMPMMDSPAAMPMAQYPWAMSWPGMY